MQLAGDGEGGEVVATDEFGMPEDEGPTQGGSDQQNQGDGRQTAVGNRLPLSGRVAVWGAMPAGVQKSVFEGPVFGQIHPAVVLVLPAIVAEVAHGGGGKDLPVERGDPKPFMIGGIGGQFPLPIVVSLQHLLGANDSHRLGVLGGERQAFAIPDLDLVGLMVPPLGVGGIGRSAGEQAGRGCLTVLGRRDPDPLPTGVTDRR